MVERINKNNAGLGFLSIMLVPIFLVIGDWNIWTSLGLSLFIYLLGDFIWKIGYFLPIPELLVLVAALQWIVGPWIDYITPETHYIYYMYIPEDEYMAYVVPSVFFLYLGTKIFSYDCDLNDLKEKAKNLLSYFPNLPFWLIGIGFVLPYFGAFMPVSLAFVFYVFSGIKYIGIIYLIYSDRSNKWLVFSGLMFLSFSLSIATGFFHDFLLWITFTFLVASRMLNLSLFTKFMLIGLVFVFTVTIQAVKTPLRNVVWQGVSVEGRGIELFASLASNFWLDADRSAKSVSINDLNVRLNQGWIISKVMNTVPNRVPHANGSTITEAINATLVPRFLNSDKAISGGKKNFELYAQHYLNNNTSMGISLAGEGFANFGYLGGIFFMFLWGLCVGWFWYKINTYSTSKYSTLMVWSPLVFQHVIKAETELLDVLNYLVKSFILIVLILYMLKIFFKIRF